MTIKRGRGHYSSIAKNRQGVTDSPVDAVPGIRPGQYDSALWEQIRYGGVTNYMNGEIDFEDTKYDPVIPD